MPEVSPKKFFAEQTAQSRVKAEIIYKYVLAWASIVLSPKFNPKGEAAYVDLFSGPGSYEDGARSTPLLIAEQVIRTPKLRNSLLLFFNDKNRSLVTSLRQEIAALPLIESLKYPPSYTSEPTTIELITRFNLSRETPQFYFLDQFGWAEITPVLIEHIFRNRKCDCAFFFRTSRVIGAVTNPNSEQAMISLLGRSRLNDLRTAFRRRPRDKEELILDQLREAMKAAGAPYFLRFPFRISGANSSQQHLVYLGKHPKGFDLMKQIMANASTVHEFGVPVIGFTKGPVQEGLFTPDPIPELQMELLRTFAGQTLTVGEIFERHQVTSERYILRNYQEALRRLEVTSRVQANPSAAERRVRNGVITMPEFVRIKFPGRESESNLIN